MRGIAVGRVEESRAAGLAPGDVVQGLEHAPTAVNRLFDGSNTGKLVVRVSEEG